VIASRDPEGTRGSLLAGEQGREQEDSGRRVEPLARFAPKALSLANPIVVPPPSVVTGRGNRLEGTADHLGLSSQAAPWRASDERARPGRHGVTPCPRPA
jgi:hypothetical protein